MIIKLPSGMVPDRLEINGGFALALAQNLNAASANLANVNSGASTAVTLTAAQIVQGIINQTGSPAGAVTDTTDTATAIIGAHGSLIPLDGSFSRTIQLINTTGQAITVAGGTGVTVSGTATIATGAYRYFLLNVASASTVTLTNIGGGTL